MENLEISAPETGPTPPVTLRAALQFTGTGAEYFRIWIVHTLFTLVTLGIYSAWAKVRKSRWFAQHTQLLGDSFDYHGRPVRILLGRCVALVLFLAYTYAFDWSPGAGVVVIVVLLVLGPLLFSSAQRFRLMNTSWRGLRFGFEAPRARVYAVCVPLLIVWTGGTVWTAMKGSLVGAGVLGIVSILAWPAIHAALKTLQHRHARIGNLQFEFRRSLGAFYGLYGKVFGITILLFMLFAILWAIVGKTLTAFHLLQQQNAALVGVLMGTSIALLAYVIGWPFFAARMQQLVWARTSAGKLRFHSNISARRLWGLVLGNMLLVILTLGLYWPFAAVAIARYRVQSLSVETEGQWPTLEAPAAADGTAVGDATLDFFDLDLGW